MFFIKFFYFLKGYVIIEVTDNLGERLISSCVAENILLFDVSNKEKVRFCIRDTDFLRLESIAKKNGIQFIIKKKFGAAFFLKRLLKRKTFIIGFLLAATSFFSMTRFLWTIEITGNERISDNKIMQVLADVGVKPGVLLHKLPNQYEMKDVLLSRLDNVSWAFVYKKGTRLSVSIHESVIPLLTVDEGIATDIVARRDGFLVSVNAKKGTAVVKPGNAVLPGEVIVSSLVPLKDENQKLYVHSDAEVFALTHHEKTKEYRLMREYKKFSGKKKIGFNIDIRGKKYTLLCPKDEEYLIEKRQITPSFLKEKLGVCFDIDEYYHYSSTTVDVPYDSAVELATRDLEAQIGKELFAGAVLQEKKVDVRDVDSNTISVTVKMDFIEQIGTQMPVEIDGN